MSKDVQPPHNHSEHLGAAIINAAIDWRRANTKELGDATTKLEAAVRAFEEHYEQLNERLRKVL